MNFLEIFIHFFSHHVLFFIEANHDAHNIGELSRQCFLLFGKRFLLFGKRTYLFGGSFLLQTEFRNCGYKIADYVIPFMALNL